MAPFHNTLTKTVIRTIAYAVISFALLACAVSPAGRKQLKLFPDSQMDSIGAQSFEQIKQQTPLSKDKNIQQYVTCVANKIIPQVAQNPHPQQWEIRVFEDKQANAFALPGYKIGVYTGLLNYAKNQHQLATVIGHEVAHVIAKHGNERVSGQMATELGLGIVTAVLGGQQNNNNAMILAGLGLGVQFGITLPFSRKHESEADSIGLDLMARSGFNPEESVPLWQNMAQAGSATPEFLSTHPSSTTRIKQLKDNIPQAKISYQSALKKGQSANCKL